MHIVEENVQTSHRNLLEKEKESHLPHTFPYGKKDGLHQVLKESAVGVRSKANYFDKSTPIHEVYSQNVEGERED